MNIDIAGLPKYAVVAALWSAARAQSVFDHKSAMSETRAREVADFVMASSLPGDRLDWVDGRVMKVDVRYDSFDPVFYDRDNGGEGHAARVIERLRQYNKVPEHVKQQKIPEVDPGSPGQVHGHSQGQDPHEAAISQWESDGGPAKPDEGSHDA